MNNVHVYERLSAPAGSDDASVWSDTAKFYLIGLGGRGQKALQELDTWERVQRCCTTVLGRKDWAPGAKEDEGVERIFGDDRPYKTKVIPRDRLAGVLREIVLSDYADAVTLHYDTELTSVRWGEDGAAVVTMDQRDELRYELLVGADGAARTLASAMERDASGASNPEEGGVGEWLARLSPLGQPRTLRVTRYEDDNRRVYKCVSRGRERLDPFPRPLSRH